MTGGREQKVGGMLVSPSPTRSTLFRACQKDGRTQQVSARSIDRKVPINRQSLPIDPVLRGLHRKLAPRQCFRVAFVLVEGATSHPVQVTSTARAREGVDCSLGPSIGFFRKVISYQTCSVRVAHVDPTYLVVGLPCPVFADGKVRRPDGRWSVGSTGGFVRSPLLNYPDFVSVEQRTV
jgi:hypothetical protein